MNVDTLPLGSEWFGRSRFVPEEARREVGAQIDACLETAGRLCGDWTASGNCLLLSGSLARREPAVVQQTDGTWRLASDFDFGAIISDSSANASEVVTPVLEGLRAAFHDVSFSMFVVQPEGLPHIRSFFGRDLIIGASRPVLGSLTHVRASMPPVTLRTRLEVIVHQLSNVLLHSLIDWEPVGRDRDQLPAQRTKIAVEALRALLPAPRWDCLRYGAVIDLPDSLPITAGTRSALIRARELSIQDVSTEVVQAVLIDSLRILLDIPSGASWDTDLVDSLAVILGRSRDVMDVYQYVVLGLSVAPSLGPSALTSLLQGLATAVARHDVADAGQREGSSPPLADSLQSFDGSPSPALLASLVRMRRTYYGLLGPHNFGLATIRGYDNLVLPHQDKRVPQ
ncbi:hypothetical protein [Streptomyces sp. NPDC091217]|uniref:hypothetical protein n=1 Tax=Streptomyces sp. NPDC091217 TaxID=3365975 RepID=UPI003820935E